MNQPLSILQVVASLQGGAARHILHLSEGLQERGHSVTIASLNDNPSVLREIREMELGWVEVDLQATFARMGVKTIFKAMAEEEAHILHMHGHRAACAIRSVLFPRDMICVYTVHGFHSKHYPNPISRTMVNSLERWQAKDTDLYISVSQSTQEDLIDLVPDARGKCCVIPNAIPMENLSDEESNSIRADLRREMNIPDDALVIGCIARLQWQKSIDRLVRAFMELPVPDARLLLVGDGPDRKRIQSLIAKKGLASRCILTGAKGNATDYLHAMDLFVLPSLWEGMPLTILEAWDACTPVVAMDVPGSRDLIEHGHTGWLAPNSTEGLIDTLNEVLILFPLWKQVAREARHHLQANHTTTAMIDATEREYYRLVNEMS